MALVEVDDQGGISFFGGRKERKFRALLFINPLRPRERKVPLLYFFAFLLCNKSSEGWLGKLLFGMHALAPVIFLLSSKSWTGF